VSAGYFRSPRRQCAACGHRLNPRITGELLALARATGETVTAPCPDCGTQIRFKTKVRRLKAAGGAG